ncbi:class I SAM-dependent methyltransferase [Nostoc sp. 'Lobaria pulmonaria (5183) cyanobiont']|uniref:class I SAM-dependent methyltransferase n=1 Tax=Nostoc sp. 'Lobaria pulmonaria (5183) cyanobiont' TaxID=1618022 RepID=UPI000CF3449A|nr:class I SAM-dependent methyltransferase [Nostoc sp. 'Lobaria pulmonaria (5183) cyanobiont']AVH71769.1 type 11 methyltransferase [Nostoc sp. 'Lobaria pulmonaria (5183) cyanobiont']
MHDNLMKNKWNERAKKDAFYYIETTFYDGDIDAFFALGEERTKLIVDPILTQLLPSASNASVLEIGCGLGRFSRALSKRFRSVIAVDVADEMIRQAKELSSEEQYANLKFYTNDGTSLSLIESESVDFVFSYEVFQHMPSLKVILNNFTEIRRVIKITGKALIHLRTETVSPLTKFQIFAKSHLPKFLLKLLGLSSIDKTWTGTTLNTKNIDQLCKSTGLEILQLINDPTHAPNTRIFVLLSPMK